MKRRRSLLLPGAAIAVLALGVLVAACGDENGGEATPTQPSATEPAETPTAPAGETPTEPAGTPDQTPSGVELEIEAENIEFDTDSLEAPAGQPFTVVFQNNDSGVEHNFAIYTDDSADDLIAATDTESGTVTQTLEVPALDAGEYYFQCDVHPQMNGTLTVQ